MQNLNPCQYLITLYSFTISCALKNACKLIGTTDSNSSSLVQYTCNLLQESIFLSPSKVAKSLDEFVLIWKVFLDLLSHVEDGAITTEIRKNENKMLSVTFIIPNLVNVTSWNIAKRKSHWKAIPRKLLLTKLNSVVQWNLVNMDSVKGTCHSACVMQAPRKKQNRHVLLM